MRKRCKANNRESWHFYRNPKRDQGWIERRFGTASQTETLERTTKRWQVRHIALKKSLESFFFSFHVNLHMRVN